MNSWVCERKRFFEVFKLTCTNKHFFNFFSSLFCVWLTFYGTSNLALWINKPNEFECTILNATIIRAIWIDNNSQKQLLLYHRAFCQITAGWRKVFFHTFFKLLHAPSSFSSAGPVGLGRLRASTRRVGRWCIDSSRGLFLLPPHVEEGRGSQLSLTGGGDGVRQAY